MEPNTAGLWAGSSPTGDTPVALASVAPWLSCPNCAAPGLRLADRRIECPAGHSFDIARQGYASLVTGRRRHAGDAPAMVAARERFLGRDHYRALRSTVTALAAEHAPPRPGLLVDLAGGIGHYLPPVVDAFPHAWGLTTDISGAALRRAARAHPRAAAVAADAWRPLPLVSGSAAVVLSIFGPRPAAEIRRVLTRGGVVVVANALPDHLRELRDRVGGIGVDPRKAERMNAAFSAFERVAHQVVTWRLALDRDDVGAVVAMGPSARHLDPARLRTATAALPDVVGVTAAMEVSVLRPR